MGFASEDEAKQFLIQEIADRALAEGCPLSEDERRMLGYSASVPDSPPELWPEDPDQDEDRLAGLLRRSYEHQCPGPAQQRYREACAAMAGGDEYLNWVVSLAGLGPPMPEWLRRVKQIGLVLLLVIPGLVALLIACAGLWAALGQASESPDGRAGMGVVALVFAGFAAFLFALWYREGRG